MVVAVVGRCDGMSLQQIRRSGRGGHGYSARPDVDFVTGVGGSYYLQVHRVHMVFGVGRDSRWEVEWKLHDRLTGRCHT